MNLIIINTPAEYLLLFIEDININNSGKKEDIGGIPALETKIKLIRIKNQNKLASPPAKTPNREEVEKLKVPAVRNIAIEVHP